MQQITISLASPETISNHIKQLEALFSATSLAELTTEKILANINNKMAELNELALARRPDAILKALDGEALTNITQVGILFVPSESRLISSIGSMPRIIGKFIIDSSTSTFKQLTQTIESLYFDATNIKQQIDILSNVSEDQLPVHVPIINPTSTKDIDQALKQLNRINQLINEMIKFVNQIDEIKPTWIELIAGAVFSKTIR